MISNLSMHGYGIRMLTDKFRQHLRKISARQRNKMKICACLYNGIAWEKNFNGNLKAHGWMRSLITRTRLFYCTQTIILPHGWLKAALHFQFPTIYTLPAVF